MNFRVLGREIFLQKWVIACIVMLFTVVVGVLGYAASGSKGAPITIQSAQSAEGVYDDKEEKSDIAEPAIEATQSLKKAEDEIKVYIVGCVKKPGVISLKKGQIIEDAIKAAGGTTAEADLEYINMAYKLQDNVMIKIKSKKVENLSSQSTSANTQERNVGSRRSGIEIVSDSGGAVQETGVGNNELTKGKVNINTATAEELDTLPGIGKETANDIISYRDKNGKFKSPSDIMKVSGIKESRFDKIKDKITAD